MRTSTTDEPSDYREKHPSGRVYPLNLLKLN
jgi:hypothetical protein